MWGNKKPASLGEGRVLIGYEPSWNANLERAKGIEPSYEAWEAAVLPLNYARVWILFIFLMR